jgi:hypothetical protein
LAISNWQLAKASFTAKAAKGATESQPRICANKHESKYSTAKVAKDAKEERLTAENAEVAEKSRGKQRTLRRAEEKRLESNEISE